MIPNSDKERKRFGVLLINTRVVYWPTCIKTKYLERIQDRINDNVIHKDLKKEQEYFKEIKDIIIKNNITDSEIISFIKEMSNPRDEYNNVLREQRKRNKDTRDNKGQFVSNNIEQKPIRDKDNNIYMCRFNSIRFPKKCRSKRTWKKFYEMFPRQAEIDGWDGKISKRIKK